jgi:peptidoglycan hydrolase CwlO-like protein
MADIDIEASLYYYYLKPMLKYAYVYLCVDIRVDREGNRMNPNKLKYSIIFMLFLGITLLASPNKAIGEVTPIEEAAEQLEGINEQEKQTLEKLFILTQEIEEMEREEERITKEINDLTIKINELDKSIIEEEENYNIHLSILEQVLISYQRGGPASYLDILLKADNLTSFIKSLNLIKDLSRNTGELLDSIEESKRFLEENRQNLSENAALLEIKREELKEPIAERKRLLKEQEDYLDSLAEERDKYQQHLDNLTLMWNNLKLLFSEVVDEFSRIIGEGHFTMEDLNLKFSFFSLKGAIHEDTFNKIMNENSTLSKIVFSFGQEKVRIEVPENHLVLDGYFTLEGGASLLFVPQSGTFYNMTLETESIDELFRNNPLVIDFEQVAGDMVTIDIKLKDIETKDGYIHFTIDTGSLF